MRLKNYVASSISEAMLLIKNELGPDAIIISTENENGLVKVVAALDEKENIDFNSAEELEIIPSRQRFDDSRLRDCLDYHGVIPVVSERILAYCRNQSLEQGISDEQRLVMSCFREMFKFGSLLDLTCPVKMFMGVPGSGKSTTIAKVATQARFEGLRSCIISTDNVRAGANNQLEAFAKILETDFFFCKGERSLYEAVRSAKRTYQLILIDTPGVNPFIQSEIENLHNQIEGELPKDGAKVVIIDDVITTGGSTLSVVEALRRGKNGKRAEVLGVFTVFDWDFTVVNKKFEDAGVSKTRITTMESVVRYGIEHGLLLGCPV